MLSIKGVSHAVICHICQYKMYWATNPEVLLMDLGLSSAISQACLAALKLVSVVGYNDCAAQSSWFEATMQVVEAPWHA